MNIRPSAFLILIVFASSSYQAQALTVAGLNFPENAFANAVLSTNASASHFVTGDPQVVVSAESAITGSDQDSYFDPSSGEYVELGFVQNVLRNREGDDFVAFCIQASVKVGGSDDVYAQLGQKVRLDLKVSYSPLITLLFVNFFV